MRRIGRALKIETSAEKLVGSKPSTRRATLISGSFVAAQPSCR